jgi:voltage-gated potassium channel Kch
VAVIIETNPKTHRELSRIGTPSVFGDVTDRKVLMEAEIDHASAIILTFADDGAILRTCRVIKSIRPDLPVACRVLSAGSESPLRELGVECVAVEEDAVANLLRDNLKDLLAARQA